MEYKEEYLGEIRAIKDIKLSTKIPGFIKKVYVKDSQKVKKGDILVKIDDKEILANLNALKVALKAQKNDYLFAKNVYERNKKLYKVGGLPKEKVESSLVLVKSKRSLWENTLQKINQLKNQLKYLLIKAPYDGVVDRVLLHEGDLAAVGRPIISFYDGRKKITFLYPQFEKIEKGMDVYFENRLIGKVANIYKSAKNSLGVAEVLLNKELSYPIGTSLKIKVLKNRVEGTILPSDTIIHKKEGDFIAIYKDKKFILKKVHILLRSLDLVAIRENINDFVAKGNERELAFLPFFKNVNVLGLNNEK
ncbi:MAG: efflux RND transporter periplasmic adaptor subunit [Epsilonproteobacteria bacterium]|nr:efflux RND transporter periplasmic adaptor subunit [Campylobacterota bacterium]